MQQLNQFKRWSLMSVRSDRNALFYSPLQKGWRSLLLEI
jgi:hypothetical protein